MVEQVMRDRVALLTYDAQSDQRLAAGESIRIHQIRSAMCVPLWSGEKIIGVLQVDTPFHAGTFNEQDLDLLTAGQLRGRRGRACATPIAPIRAPGAAGSHHSRVSWSRSSTASTAAGEAPVRKAEVTVLFADLVGFRRFRAPFSGGCRQRSRATSPACEAIRRGRHARQFIGDCVWRSLALGAARRSQRAVRALKILDAQVKWNAERVAAGQPTLSMRIAINSGPVVVGDVGSNRRVDYTVLGNTVNVAARLEGYVGEAGEITVGGETHRLLAGAYPSEALGEFQLKGLQKKIEAFRIKRGHES
jgi:adenylate cyclase